MNRRLFKNLNKNSFIRIFIAYMFLYIVAMNIIFRERGMGHWTVNYTGAHEVF